MNLNPRNIIIGLWALSTVSTMAITPQEVRDAIDAAKDAPLTLIHFSEPRRHLSIGRGLGGRF
ncbi:MAG: hypothetical protein K2I35_00640, partial [Duncaniella sp.]|nr:hypothetical protein [Duncaniella sp.]